MPTSEVHSFMPGAVAILSFKPAACASTRWPTGDMIRALPGLLGHRNIQHRPCGLSAVQHAFRYTELASDRFKDFLGINYRKPRRFVTSSILGECSSGHVEAMVGEFLLTFSLALGCAAFGCGVAFLSAKIQAHRQRRIKDAWR